MAVHFLDTVREVRRLIYAVAILLLIIGLFYK
jgi:phosphate starvation-inducible membrane PsiE